MLWVVLNSGLIAFFKSFDTYPYSLLGIILAEEVEYQHILCILEAAHWVIEGKEGAAALLGLSPSTLRYRMQKLGIRRPQVGQ